MFTHKFLKDWDAAVESAAASTSRRDEITADELGAVSGLKISSTLKAGGWPIHVSIHCTAPAYATRICPEMIGIFRTESGPHC